MMNNRRPVFLLAAVLTLSFAAGPIQSETTAGEAAAQAESEPAESPSESGDEETEAAQSADRIAQLDAETLIDEATVDFENADRYFISSEIDDSIFERIDGKSYGEECTVPREDLRYLKVLHYDFDGNIRTGELIVNRYLEEDFLDCFQQLFENRYPIFSMYLVDDFDADDSLSVENNNTSCFNFRPISGGTTLSYHAYGAAVDVNPMNNPYVYYDESGNLSWDHENAGPYIDRTQENASELHMITEGDICWQIFTDHGFTWGGSWHNPIDYQHFQKDVPAEAYQ